MNTINILKLVISCAMLAAIAQIVIASTPGVLFSFPLIVAISAGLGVGVVLAISAILWGPTRVVSNNEQRYKVDEPIGSAVLSTLFVATTTVALGVFMFPVLPLVFTAGVSALSGLTVLFGFPIAIPVLVATMIMGVVTLVVSAFVLGGTYSLSYYITKQEMDENMLLEKGQSPVTETNELHVNEKSSGVEPTVTPVENLLQFNTGALMGKQKKSDSNLLQQQHVLQQSSVLLDEQEQNSSDGHHGVVDNNVSISLPDKSVSQQINKETLNLDKHGLSKYGTVTESSLSDPNNEEELSVNADVKTEMASVISLMFCNPELVLTDTPRDQDKAQFGTTSPKSDIIEEKTVQPNEHNTSNTQDLDLGLDLDGVLTEVDKQLEEIDFDDNEKKSETSGRKTATV